MKGRRDPPELKERLRHDLRAARRGLAADVQKEAAQALIRQAGPTSPLAAARHVTGYMASDGEIDLTPLLDHLRQKGVGILLPRCRTDRHLDLVAFTRDTPLHPTGPGQILEPSGPAVALEELALPAVLITPAVALDHEGNRLGRGGGAYDRLLPRLRDLGWQIIGACHRSQVVTQLPREPHDVAVDMLLTETSLEPIPLGTGAEPNR